MLIKKHLTAVTSVRNLSHHGWAFPKCSLLGIQYDQVPTVRLTLEYTHDQADPLPGGRSAQFPLEMSAAAVKQSFVGMLSL